MRLSRLLSIHNGLARISSEVIKKPLHHLPARDFCDQVERKVGRVGFLWDIGVHMIQNNGASSRHPQNTTPNRTVRRGVFCRSRLGDIYVDSPNKPEIIRNNMVIEELIINESNPLCPG